MPIILGLVAFGVWLIGRAPDRRVRIERMSSVERSMYGQAQQAAGAAASKAAAAARERIQS